MLSEMARQDLIALRSEGINPTDAQVVNLHALGVLVERGRFASEVFEAPRVAFAGGVPFYEPTLQSEKWYHDFAAAWWSGESLFWSLAWACRYSVTLEFFESKTDEKEVRKEIEKWGRRLPCTVRQINAALVYALNGTETSPDVPCAASDAPEKAGGCLYADLVNSAMAAGLGLTPERIAIMPRRRILDVLRKWTANQIAANGGSCDMGRDDKTDAYVRYDDYLISIRNRAAQIYG